mgnify:FL=1
MRVRDATLGGDSNETGTYDQSWTVMLGPLHARQSKYEQVKCHTGKLPCERS